MDSDLTNYIGLPNIITEKPNTLERSFSTITMISQSINTDNHTKGLALMGAAITTLLKQSANKTVLDQAFIDTNNSTISTLEHPTFLTSLASAISVVTKDHKQSIFSSFFEKTRLILKAVSNFMQPFSGVSLSGIYYVKLLSSFIIERVQQFSQSTYLFVQRITSYVQKLLKLLSFSKRSRTIYYPSAALYTIIFTAPQIKICFMNFASLIRKIYLLHARERESSDDENNFYSICNYVVFYS